MSLMRHVKHIHLIGIGGVGMCGIAEVLKNSGYQVSGSDLAETSMVKYLRSIGISVQIGHKEEQVVDSNVVVQSTAVADDNPEIIAAKRKQIPVIPRAEMLAELMRYKHGIAIAGTHGKTTTTSLVSSILAKAGLDPSFVIGGKLNSIGTNARLGHSPYFIAEADESDASFLYLKPMMAVVTNIDEDHMSTYNGDFNQLQKTFIDFLQHLPFYGLAVLCVDDEKVREIITKINRPSTTYGFNETAQVRAVNWCQKGLSSYFTVQRKGYPDLNVEFNLPGEHNVQNALAAIAIATELEVKDEIIQQALLEFEGVGRRFQMHGELKFENKAVSLIDDYGHHPREISSTIQAIRRVWPKRRLLHVFQPHRYSRTQALFNDFSSALTGSDQLVLLDVYAAGEQPIKGITSDDLARSIRNKVTNFDVRVCSMDEIRVDIANFVKDGDILLVQGAGSIGQLAKNLSKAKLTVMGEHD